MFICVLFRSSPAREYLAWALVTDRGQVCMRQNTVLTIRQLTTIHAPRLLAYLSAQTVQYVELRQNGATALLGNGPPTARNAVVCKQPLPPITTIPTHTSSPGEQTCSLAHPGTLKLDFLSKINTRHSKWRPSCATTAQCPAAQVHGRSSLADLPALLRDSPCFLAYRSFCLSLHPSKHKYKSPIKSL